mgnify:CR=1 FL=1|tara:strand:+ start:1134 stop:1316 length:183 start_codon:yes stop_codon:yes gene_type:complete
MKKLGVHFHKVNHVNFVMQEINDLTDDIYESLMDEEYSTSQCKIDSLISKLKEVGNSIKV